MKVPDSKGCTWKNYSSIFQIKEDIFICTPLKIEESIPFQETVNSPNHKESMDAIKDEMDSMIRNKV